MSIPLLRHFSRVYDRHMTTDKDKSSRGGGAVVVAILLLLMAVPLLYVLSIGPAVLYYADRQDTSWPEAFYMPLIWLSDNSEIAERVLEGYVELWTGD